MSKIQKIKPSCFQLIAFIFFLNFSCFGDEDPKNPSEFGLRNLSIAVISETVEASGFKLKIKNRSEEGIFLCVDQLKSVSYHFKDEKIGQRGEQTGQLHQQENLNFVLIEERGEKKQDTVIVSAQFAGEPGSLLDFLGSEGEIKILFKGFLKKNGEPFSFAFTSKIKLLR